MISCEDVLRVIRWKFDTGESAEPLPRAVRLHLVGCAECMRALMEAHDEVVEAIPGPWNETSMPALPQRNPYQPTATHGRFQEATEAVVACGHDGTSEQLFGRIRAYCHGGFERNEAEFEERVLGCPSCRAQLRAVLTEDATSNGLPPPGPTIDALATRLRRERLLNLTQDFAAALRPSPAGAAGLLQGTLDGLLARIRNTWVHPVPAFAPSFGGPVTPKLRVLSPHGLVRDPVLFSWEPVEGAHEYVARVRSTGWRESTPDTALQVGLSALGIPPENWFDWELEALDTAGNRIARVSGAATTSSPDGLQRLEKLERGSAALKSSLYRPVVWAGVLEQHGFLAEAALNYRKVYKIEPDPALAYRIAACYHALELEGFRDEWNTIPLSKHSDKRPPQGSEVDEDEG